MLSGPVGDAKVTTIEGLDPEGRHPVQVASACQSGQIMPGRHASEGLSESHRPGHERGDGWKPLPLHDSHSDTQGHQAPPDCEEESPNVTTCLPMDSARAVEPSRRGFLIAVVVIRLIG
jgi:hypothetical protein